MHYGDTNATSRLSLKSLCEKQFKKSIYNEEKVNFKDSIFIVFIRWILKQ